jgi:hypothetical protein
MTTENWNCSRFGGAALRRSGRAVFLMLPIGLTLACAVDHGAQAQSQTGVMACNAALDSLMSRWQSIGFVEPSKPAQMVVAGGHGYSTTGGQFNFMRQQIRVAAQNCEQGHDAEALRHIDTVRGILDHDKHI